MRPWRSIGWGFGVAAAFYLLLIDTLDLPELAVMVVVAALAGVAYLAAGYTEIGAARVDPRWLLRAGRPIAAIPRQVITVSVAALAQLVSPRPARGRFRTVPFATGDDPETVGRIALAEGFGSLAPNTIVLGVDEAQGLMLVHQLVPSGDREQLDVMRLG